MLFYERNPVLWNSIIVNWLSSPIVYLTVGALVTAYLAQSWQYRQKALEIKTDLVRRISQSIMARIKSHDYIMNRIEDFYRSRTQDKLLIAKNITDEITNLEKTRVKFETSNAEIGTEIETYFSCRIQAKWLYLVDTTFEYLHKFKYESFIDDASVAYYEFQEESRKIKIIRDQIVRDKLAIVREILDSPIRKLPTLRLTDRFKTLTRTGIQPI